MGYSSINTRGNAYELGNCVGGRSEVLGAAALCTRAGCHHLGIQPTAEEAPQGLRRPEGDPAGHGGTAARSLL